MLHTYHRGEEILIVALTFRHGGTVKEIAEAINQSGAETISIDAIKRHLPGLLRFGLIAGEQQIREEKLVTVWVPTPAWRDAHERNRELQGLEDFFKNAQDA